VGSAYEATGLYFAKVWDLGIRQNFLPKYCDSLKRDSIFGKAPQRFWAIIAKFGFFGFLWMTRITKFSYLGVIWLFGAPK
jgi:hypothetical protein